MSLGEFDLINRYFRRSSLRRDDVVIGIGDDGAVVHVAADTQVASAMVTLSAGSPGTAGDDGALLGHEIVAMALNRLATLGADPAWLTLALTLPEANPEWLAAFSDALLHMADAHGMTLVGGDTTRGPLTVCVLAHGLLTTKADHQAPELRPGDGIYVTGELGDALLATASRDGRLDLDHRQRSALHERLFRRAPRLAVGHTVTTRGGVAMDLGEGLLWALSALTAAGDAGVTVELAELPLASPLAAHLPRAGGWPALLAQRGDIELCFSLPPGAEDSVVSRATAAGVPITRVGRGDDSGGVCLLQADGARLTLPGAWP
jgi:thiamine-monophosphate kinase